MKVVSWFTRNTKNWHIVYNWLPYSKPIERDALCPDVLVADLKPHVHWHTDISYVKIQHRFYFFSVC